LYGQKQADSTLKSTATGSTTISKPAKGRCRLSCDMRKSAIRKREG